VVGADRALETGSVDELAHLVTDAATEGIRERFGHARELKKHADHNVDAGRDYVAAYVEYVHYVEGVYAAATKSTGHHGEAAVGMEPAAALHDSHAH